MTNYIPPVIGPVTQDVFPRHQAIDQACIAGSDVRAMGNGYGQFHWEHEKGWTFVQSTPLGEIRMSHLAFKGVDRFYNVGEVVNACGSTGAYSTGPHVHIEAPPSILKQVYGM